MRVRQATAMLYAAEARADTARQMADSIRAIADRWRVKAEAQSAKVTLSGVATQRQIERARSAVSDTSAAPAILRQELSQLAETTEKFHAEVLTYQRTIDSVLVAQRFERQRWDAERVALQDVIDGQAVALEDGCGANRFVPCPTRWQAFAAGFAIAIAIVAIF